MKEKAGVRNRAGYVMIVALFVILVTMTAALLVAASIHRQSRMYIQERQQAELTAMADGALALALSSLWGDPDYKGTAEPQPFAGGTIEIEVVKLSGLKVEVVVRATYGGSGRAARAQVKIDRDPPDRRDAPEVLLWEPITYRRTDSGGAIKD